MSNDSDSSNKETNPVSKVTNMLEMERPIEEIRSYLENNNFNIKYHFELRELWNKSFYREFPNLTQSYVRKCNPPPSTIWNGNKLHYNKEEYQINGLLMAFEENPEPSTERKIELSRQLHLDLKYIYTWFNNQRALNKKLQKKLQEQYSNQRFEYPPMRQIVNPSTSRFPQFYPQESMNYIPTRFFYPPPSVHDFQNYQNRNFVNEYEPIPRRRNPPISTYRQVPQDPQHSREHIPQMNYPVPTKGTDNSKIRELIAIGQCRGKETFSHLHGTESDSSIQDDPNLSTHLGRANRYKILQEKRCHTNINKDKSSDENISDDTPSNQKRKRRNQ